MIEERDANNAARLYGGGVLLILIAGAIDGLQADGLSAAFDFL